jgi:Uma2 family endonuclease
MATRTKRPELPENMQELMERLGDVPPERIRLRPRFGTATEADVLAAEAEPRKRLCELIDGVLVEKAMGARESLLGSLLAHFLWGFIEKRELGIVLGADGMLRLFPGRVRIPDVSFIAKDRLREGVIKDNAIAPLSPNLAVEILSPSNTKREMELKLRDYFQSGTELVWLIQPKTQTAEVYTAPDEKRRVAKNQTLDGGNVLPGFRLPLAELFARVDRGHRS